MTDQSDVWLIMPVYNEAAVVADVLDEALRVFPNVVCVDDGSRDASVAAIRRTGARLVRHPLNLGQGAALQTGIEYARSRPGARYFVTFDADGQHRVADAAAMVEVLRAGGADIVVGSRFGGDTRHIPLLKKLVLRTAARLSPAGRSLQLTDSHNGLRAFNRLVADEIDLTSNGMAHASEFVLLIARRGWRVIEQPVRILYSRYARAKGQSLLNGVNIVFETAVRPRV